VRLLFYAPLKPPKHPVPSGDRRMARLLREALALAGHEPELVSHLRSYDRAGDPAHQARIQRIGTRIAACAVAHMRGRPLSQRPRGLVTYHLYEKAPDWVGPTVARHLAIPYIVVEASVSPKRANGPWAQGQRAVIAALGAARAVISPNPRDEQCVAPYLAREAQRYRLPPFLDAIPFARAARERMAHRHAIARRFALDPARPWLLAVAMMRPGDKRESYRVLAEALAQLTSHDWQLLVVGDGPERASIAADFAALGARVQFAGKLGEAELPSLYAACDLYVWPAVSEAYGLATLEAQASGLPVVAGRSGGIDQIVADGATGLLVTEGDPGAFAAATRMLLDDPERRRALGAAALARVARHHTLTAAAAALDRILKEVCA
jgi:glycosyltransferase involved in cell wall biosynthesis